MFHFLSYFYNKKDYEEKESKNSGGFSKRVYRIFFKTPDKSRPIEIIRARPSALAYRFLIRSNRNGFGKRLSSSRDNTLFIGNRVCQSDFRAESFPPPAATRYKLRCIIVALSGNANLRWWYGSWSRWSWIARTNGKSPAGSKDGGGWDDREEWLLKGIRIVGRSES